MTSVFSRAALLAGAMTFGLAAMAFAGETPKPAGPDGERRVMVMGGPGGGGMHPGGPGGMGMHHRMDPEKHAEHLRTMLQLRPDQEGALKAFIEATKPEMRTERRAAPAEGAPAPKPMTTPERLDMAAKRMAEHQARFQKRAAATRAFYAQLSPSQQKAFDALHMVMRRMHGPGGRDVRVMRRGGAGGPHGPGGPGGPGAPMVWQGDGAGGDMVFIHGGEGDEAFEIELSEGPEGDED